MITILNTSIITAHGTYTYKACSLEQAREMVKNREYQSAVGHDSTAKIISILLGVEVKMNRIQYQQQTGEVALVFKLKARAPEGEIPTREKIEEIGFEWGILERTDKAYDHSYNPPSLPKAVKIKRYIKEKLWWVMDYIIMPVICFILAIGFIAGAASGIEHLFFFFM